MRVGAYPGTFDPPTVAHLAIAAAARDQCRLDAVDLIVNSEPLGKAACARSRPGSRCSRRWPSPGRGSGSWSRTSAIWPTSPTDYDVLVLGADKWAQVLDAGFYASESARDDACRPLPQLAVAPGAGSLSPMSASSRYRRRTRRVSSTARATATPRRSRRGSPPAVDVRTAIQIAHHGWRDLDGSSSRHSRWPGSACSSRCALATTGCSSRPSWCHTRAAGCNNMAEAWLVFQLTDSGAAVGATFAFRFAPVFLFGLWGGSIVDRLDRVAR